MKKLTLFICLIFCGYTIHGAEAFFRGDTTLFGMSRITAPKLISVIKRGNEDQVSKVLGEGNILATLRETGPKGHSALQEAVILGNPNIFNTLMRAIASLTKDQQHELLSHTNQFGFNALLDAIEHNRLAMVTGLLRAIAKFSPDQIKTILNQVSFNGETPLMIAARKGYSELVQLLLQQEHMDPAIPNREGITAAQLTTDLTIKKMIQDAIEQRKKDIKEVLLESTPLDPDTSGLIAEFLYGKKPKKQK